MAVKVKHLVIQAGQVFFFLFLVNTFLYTLTYLHFYCIKY